MLVQLCLNEGVGIGVQAATMIPRGTRVLYYYGDVLSNQEAHKVEPTGQTHFMTVSGTGCTINGAYHVLFPGEFHVDFNQTYQVPCGLMSLTNSSHGYKEANCKVHIDNNPTLYANGYTLDRTVWLVTTRTIQAGEELIWSYLVR